MEKTKKLSNNKIFYTLLILSVVLIGVLFLAVQLFKKGIVSNYWPLTIMFPIPVITIIFARIAIKRKIIFIGRISLYIGIVSVIVILIASIFMIVFSKYEKRDFEFVNRIEGIIDFEFPDQGSIITKDKSLSTRVNSKYKTLSRINFDYSTITELENRIIASEKWTSIINDNMYKAIPYYLYSENVNYYLLYNLDTRQFNSNPDLGLSDYILIYYYGDGQMSIVEYTFEYVEGK